jgi:subtilisin family serine protease
VEVPDAEAQALAQVPGVKRVRPVREFHLLLDRALPLHHVPEAWSAVGEGNAGRGIKIAIIDTGIDITHPAFADTSLTAPSGYPRANQDADLEYTNGKVIVARSYTSLLRRRDPDNSPRDHIGHGTATAMAAAGGRASGPLAVIEGVAPQAWLGNYKVFGSPGTNDFASEDAILKAIDDAVADGMDVISMSLGSDLASLPQDDLEVQAIERASAAGVVVVVAAGNNGPDPNTIASPATAPSAIAVGATSNDRVFSGSLAVDGLGSLLARPGAGPNRMAPVSGPLADVSGIDGDGLACSSFPPDSLRGQVALILRGTCVFEDKLNNAERAGAIAAVVYTDETRPDPISMAVGAARLPASMVSYEDGTRLKQRIATGPATVTLQFTLGAVAVNSQRLADFSGTGPSIDFSIKPDLVAVGTNVYTAAQRLDSSGEIYDTTGFAIEQGTSFSAPLVAGAVAVLKAARPGLTAAQYRSLLINTAAPDYFRPGVFANAQQGGAGSLNLDAALRTTAAAAPVSLSFGVAGPDPIAQRTFTISNTGTVAEAFTITVSPSTAGPVPQVPGSTVELNPGFAVDIPVEFRGSSLSAGQYEGSIYVQGVRTGSLLRIPYWYAAPSAQPAHITTLVTQENLRRNTSVSDAVIFRVTDAAGIPVQGVDLKVTVVSGDGEVVKVVSRDRVSPGAYGVELRMGPRSGTNTFRIEAGGVLKDVTFVTQ